MAKIQALLEIMSQLRDPEGGCPWDLAQDFSSISPHTIEEAYEVDEAIASGDLESLRDELGDLLFQVVFQSRIAQEQGAFDFEAVTETIISKLIRRHPHIFADAETPTSVSAQVVNWESIKAEERAEADRARSGPSDAFSGIPRNLPALARCAKLAGRLARIKSQAGDKHAPAESGDILTHLEAAIVPAKQALRSLSPDLADNTDRESTSAHADRTDALQIVGTGLRAWVWLARELGVDPEQALRQIDDETITVVRQKIRARLP